MTAAGDVTWTRSTYSGPDGCVEARRVGSVVEVREGLFGDRSLVQVWEPWEWDDLLAAVKRGPAGGVDEPYRLVATSGDPLVYLGTVRHQTAYGRLLFDAEEWGAFARGVDGGQFDWDRLARSETSSGAGERSGDGGTSPAAAATGAGGGAVLPVPVAALPERPLVSESARVAARRAVRKVYDNGIFMTSMETGDVLEACADAAVDAFLEAIWGAAIAPLVSVDGAA